LLSEIRSLLSAGTEPVVAFTGAGGRLAAEHLSAPFISDYRAIVAGVAFCHPLAESIIEIGGTRSSYLQLQHGETGGGQELRDYSTNGACAAGSGSFLDQQALRLGLEITELAEMAAAAGRSTAIAGRCSVFARSDMIHAQQKGAAPEEILRGLCEALARSYTANVLKGRTPGGQTIFVGGVAQNKAVVDALRENIGVADHALVVPTHCSHYPAIGAALLQRMSANTSLPFATRPETIPLSPSFTHGSCPALTLQNVQILKAEELFIPVSGELPVYLGIDIGSVSTNLVCTDRDGVLLREIYLRTQGRPLQVVAHGLAQLYDEFGERLTVLGVGTTGSGRELIGELLGADTINDEITAHTIGARRIAARCLDRQVDTILEIGGQDAKFIRLENGIVVDFAMNEACSAGTGSFLEEQAERLGVDICGEFSRLALTAELPVRLGERCTVFMEQDVTDALGRGETKANLSAGVAYAVVHNYLNRVKGARPVGETVFFQGGTAYNHAVAAAFSQVLGKTVVIPPHNGVIGAYGAALLARERMLTKGGGSDFRGFDCHPDDCQRREFTCSACSNNCTVQEFSRDGRVSYWGDKCAVRFRRQTMNGQTPVVEDLCALRERELYRDFRSEFLAGDHGDSLRHDARRAAEWAGRKGTARRVAMARSLYHFEYHPFWNAYLSSLGLTVELSPATTGELAADGIAHTVAEPCFPIQVAHGHANALCHGTADLILLPAHINAETTDLTVQSHFCPWGQTLPFVLSAGSATATATGRLLTPILHFRVGLVRVE
jgi:predicted CoA-substrate-specific enzyme activase